MKLKAIKVNSARSEQGGWVKDIAGFPGVRLCVRGFESEAFKLALSRRQLAITNDDREDGKPDGRVKPKVTDRVFGLAMADAILLDWDGIEGDDDQPIPYSRELAEQYLTDPDFRLFREAVALAGSLVESETDTRVEAALGNSPDA